MSVCVCCSCSLAASRGLSLLRVLCCRGSNPPFATANGDFVDLSILTSLDTTTNYWTYYYNSYSSSTSTPTFTVGACFVSAGVASLCQLGIACLQICGLLDSGSVQCWHRDTAAFVEPSTRACNVLR